MADKSDNKVAIIVAIIGLIGTISSALISNLDKIYKNGSEVNSSTKSPNLDTIVKPRISSNELPNLASNKKLELQKENPKQNIHHSENKTNPQSGQKEEGTYSETPKDVLKRLFRKEEKPDCAHQDFLRKHVDICQSKYYLFFIGSLSSGPANEKYKKFYPEFATKYNEGLVKFVYIIDTKEIHTELRENTMFQMYPTAILTNNNFCEIARFEGSDITLWNIENRISYPEQNEN